MSKKLIRFDWAIKRLLRNKANFVVLEGFLSELLFDNIKIEQILESEGNQETDDDKFNRVDILTQNSKNELIIIEIQNTYEIDYFHRMAYGVSKSISENLKLGQKYLEIKKVISINIVYFDLGHGQDYIYRGKTDFKGLHQNDILGLTTKQQETFSKEEVYEIFPEYYILKVNQFNDIAKDTLDEWIYLLKSPTKTNLPKDAPDRELKFELTGNMNRYVWSLDNKVVSETDKILIKKGENIRITIHNGSMMRHPMHLHGHDFRLINGQGDYAP